MFHRSSRVERTHSYQDALEQSLADRTIKVTNDLLPFLRAVEAEEEAIPAAGPLARRQRDILFGWYFRVVLCRGYRS